MIFCLPSVRRCLGPILISCSAFAVAQVPEPAVPSETPVTSAAEAVPLNGASSVAHAVVKVFATSRAPDPYKPWAKQAPAESTGTGVVIEGKRILTNAHVVAYASQIQIQANQAGDKVNATVVAIAPGIDLAVLKLDDETFFETHDPLARANTLPEIKDAVLAYGYPTGGTSLSITKGIVSRIEFTPYNPPVAGLRIQIDAAINPGNSGGPAIVDDKMIGVAFSSLNSAQNIGYIIPNEEIELFLKDIEDGRYDGKPNFFDDLQTLDNLALRAFLKLDKGVKGIVVHRPYRKDAAYPLKKWDVITHVDGTQVDDQGMVIEGAELRLNLRYLVQKRAKNGVIPLTILRAGKPMRIDLPVPAERPYLIPDLKSDYPLYFVYGPLVFSKASAQFVSFMNGNANAMAAFSFVRSPLVTRRWDSPDAQQEELVVVASPFFPHKLAVGYANPAFSVVDTVNGTKIRSLRHLVALLRDMKDEFVSIETDNRGGETMVFAHKEMLSAVEDILSDNGVRAQGSPSLMELWKSKRAP
jgi:S1-C subfamily serine protease